ncbi:adenine phosphoribosyltransferase [Candidatus Sumerlaeota bacterium]|nr:adenine phosphoribosyltransferase [Candidatus Sumerlaeota bacterium]
MEQQPMDVLAKVRNVPDFPKPGIQFKDITTLIADGEAFRAVIDILAERYRNGRITRVVGVESRGFIFGAALADRLGVGFVPIRKLGKLPAETLRRSYALEYGEATVEVHKDSLDSGDRVVIIDDLLATGGTLRAACELVEELGATIEEVWVLIELAFLPGREKLTKWKVHAQAIVEGE